ncbi:type IV secretion system DNA-binding domain-containing protein [Pauljensenia sp. UMB3104]|uniref:type IV secretory system conjugative DNA transfer family protein n=1 Tax=Pauljensenia sp. UMB3104 TaxID=3046331 RepID=UPI00255099CB|nr:type IV secretion system DNA-binding domain-containing protein [Pauljensenia sp. UMB3104]MDK7158834.1 type IV secretion system DNA-binding domain-containing protein [Pauljensenia sp. UMB3104]
MSAPRIRFTRNVVHTEKQQVARFIFGAAVILNPLTATIAGAIVALGRIGRDRIHAWWVCAAGALATGLGIWMGWATTYGDTYITVLHDLWSAFLRRESTTSVIHANWQTWAIAQAPFAACAGILVAGIYLAYRRRFDATWREIDDDAGPRARTKRPASAKRVHRAKARQRAATATAPAAATVNDLDVPIGVDEAARPVSLDAAALRTHGVVIGPTGVGKTQALERVLYGFTGAPASRDLHLPAVVIDMKADPDLAATLAAIAKQTGRQFRHVTVDATGTSYNPLAGLTADEMSDALYETLFAADKNVNLHYATLSRRLLQQACRVCVDLADARVARVGGGTWQIGLADVADLLSIKTLRSVTPFVSPAVAASLTRYLDDLDASKNEGDVGDVRDRVAVIVDTAAGRTLDATGFQLEHAIRAGDIVCLSLDAAGAPQTARTIGTLAVQDLCATFGRLARDGWGKTHMCPVILDEFGALGTPRVADLYARARSAGGAVLLATQDLDADLEAVSPQFAASVRTNANVWLVLRQTRGEAADAIARDIGSRLTWKETVQVEDDWDALGGMHAASGVGSLREVDEFILHPNDIKSLPQGGAYLVVKVPSGTINAAEADTRIERVHINALTDECTANIAMPAKQANIANVASQPVRTTPTPEPQPATTPATDMPEAWPDAPDWE